MKTDDDWEWEKFSPVRLRETGDVNTDEIPAEFLTETGSRPRAVLDANTLENGCMYTTLDGQRARAERVYDRWRLIPWIEGQYTRGLANNRWDIALNGKIFDRNGVQHGTVEDMVLIARPKKTQQVARGTERRDTQVALRSNRQRTRISEAQTAMLLYLDAMTAATTTAAVRLAVTGKTRLTRSEQASLSRSLHRLVEVGYVKIQVNGHVYITDSGRNLLNRIMDAVVL